MLSFLTYIVDVINTVVHFIVNTVVSMVNIIRMMPVFTTYTMSLFSWLPQPIAAFALLGLSITVLLFIIGRQT